MVDNSEGNRKFENSGGGPHLEMERHNLELGLMIDRDRLLELLSLGSYSSRTPFETEREMLLELDVN